MPKKTKRPRNLAGSAQLVTPDGGLMKLGKRERRTDPRTLQLRDYLDPVKLPEPPAEVSYCVKVPSWPMLLNDVLGDCVIAAMGHMVQQWTFYASGGAHMLVMADAEAQAAYSAIGGYVPGDPETDNGIVLLDALNYWRKRGIVVAGQLHQIAGYVQVNQLDPLEMLQATWLFANRLTGVQLPRSVQGRPDWTVPDGGIYTPAGMPGGWGGHCVPNMARSPETDTCITWARRLKMSHNFFSDYVDECYAVLSPDWFGSLGKSPQGLNVEQLRADLRAISVL